MYWSLIERIIKIGFVEKIIGKDSFTRESIEVLYRGENSHKMMVRAWGIKFGIIGIAVIICVLCFVICGSEESDTKVIVDKHFIEREDVGGRKSFNIRAQSGSVKVEDKIDINLDKRKLNDRECKELDKYFDSFVEDNILGENKSKEKVENKLNFVDKIVEKNVEISWDTDEKYISGDGELVYENIPDEGVYTEVNAHGSYNGWSRDYSVSLFLPKPEKLSKDVVVSKIKKSIEESVLSQDTEQKVVLPTTVDGYRLEYEDEVGEKSYSVFYISLLLLILIPFMWKKKVKDKLDDRREELRLSYPEVVNKVMLLMSAGLSVSGAFDRMASDYVDSIERGGEKKYVYEEICVTCREINAGVSQTDAIAAFGRRCMELSYLRFSTLLEQNIKKGSEGLIELLEFEVKEAFEKRKEAVKQVGEKAGTKLLMPMMLMLVIVMIIVVVPAFMSMSM